VPHDAIGYDPSRHSPYIRIGLETPVGQVLAGAFFALTGQLDDLQMSDAPALAAGLSDLIRAMVLLDLQGERGLMVVRSARREAMRAYIERHLHDPALGIASLCQGFGASRATIYRDFEALGGIAEYVMKRRLERALADLADCQPSRGAVTAIAESWGFESLQHFSRRFKEQFGISPSDVVGLGRTDASDAAGVLPSLDSGATKHKRRVRIASWFSTES
jgi:AraC-like DNA-binding protein